MGKRNQAVDESTGVEVEAGSAEGGSKGRARVLLNVDGNQVPRVEYIRKRFAEGATRSQITKEVSDLQGTAVKYQVIFAATRDLSEKAAVAAEAVNADEYYDEEEADEALGA